MDSAFLYADLDEDIWMAPTPDMDLPKGYDLRLLKSLYGLKQAPWNWNKHIKELILNLGFKQSILDNCLDIVQVNDETYLLSLYVDDVIIAGANLENVEILKLKFTELFDIKDLGEINHSVGMNITRSQGGIKIDQTTYANDVVKRFERYLTSNLDKKYNTSMKREFKITKSDFN